MPVIPCDGGILSISANGGFATGPGVSFADANGVTFGVAGNTITASVVAGGGGGIGVAVPGTTITTGTVVFSNSNGVSFGINGSTLTASVGPSFALAAGTQTATSGTVVVANSNGVTFGMSGSSQITASVAAGATATGNFGALAAGTQTATSGTVVFANSNLVTFGMSDSSQVTASIPAGATATGNLGGIAAGTQTVTAGTVIFSNANGVSFGLDNSTVTASVVGGAGAAKISYWDNTIVPTDTINMFFASRTIFQRVAFAHPIDATRMDLVMSWNSGTTNNSSTNATMVVGIYTMTGSTANQVSSFTTNLVTTAVSASFLRTFPVSFQFSESEYWVGIGFTASGVPVLGGLLLNMWSAISLIPSFGDALVTGVSNAASLHVTQQAANPQGRPSIRFWGTV